MSNLKHPIPLRVDYDLPAGYRLPPAPRRSARPARNASPRRRPRRVLLAEAVLRRRSLARRAWRRRKPAVEAACGALMLLVLVVFYALVCWRVGGLLVTDLHPLMGGLHVHVH